MKIITSLIALTTLAAIALTLLPQIGLAAQFKFDGKEICDPTKTDLNEDGGGCGLTALQKFISAVIQWLIKIVIHIASLAIAWGGVMIMTSTGNPGRYQKGWEVVKIAVVGVVILLVSALIVQGVFYLLGAEKQYIPPLNPVQTK